MFTKESKISSLGGELVPFIDGIDLYNSKLLYLLSDPSVERSAYEITVHEYRPDLIAKDFYGSEDYLPYVILSTGLSLPQFKKGVVLSLITKSSISSILKQSM
jgi:hypothetical protein